MNAKIPKAEDRLGELFQQLEGRFQQAAVRCGGPIVIDHRIAQRPVRLQFAGRSLASTLSRAFAHLGVGSGETQPELTVSLWDSHNSGVAMPRPPWTLSDYTARGDILGHNTERFRTSYHVHSGIFNMIDLATGRAIYWVKDATAIPGYATGIPLLPILHWWMAGRGMQLVHAAAIGLPDGAALLAGQGGAGKSSTALACLASGLQYVSDDYCLIELDPAPRAHSVSGAGRLHAPDLERQGFFRPFVSNPQALGTDKALFFLHECLPQRVVPDLPLRIILLPRVMAQRETTWEPAEPASAHRALTAVTLHYLPGAGRAALDTIARAVKTLPCWFLNLGTKRTSVPTAVRSVLETVR